MVSDLVISTEFINDLLQKFYHKRGCFLVKVSSWQTLINELTLLSVQASYCHCVNSVSFKTALQWLICILKVANSQMFFSFPSHLQKNAWQLEPSTFHICLKSWQTEILSNFLKLRWKWKNPLRFSYLYNPLVFTAVRWDIVIFWILKKKVGLGGIKDSAVNLTERKIPTLPQFFFLIGDLHFLLQGRCAKSMMAVF